MVHRSEFGDVSTPEDQQGLGTYGLTVLITPLGLDGKPVGRSLPAKEPDLTYQNDDGSYACVTTFEAFSDHSLKGILEEVLFEGHEILARERRYPVNLFPGDALIVYSPLHISW